VFTRKKVHEVSEIASTEKLNKKKLSNDDNDGFKAMPLEKHLGHVPVHGKNKSKKNCSMCNLKK
jgi:hypothetical protein